jgi:hypothetical protein
MRLEINQIIMKGSISFYEKNCIYNYVKHDIDFISMQ